MRFEKERIIKFSAAVALCVAAVIVCLKFGSQVLYVSSKFAVKSVASLLPSSVFDDDIKQTQNSEEKTESQKNEGTENETTEETKKAEKNITETAKQTAVADDDFYETPDEIKKLIKQAQEKAKSDKKDGAIYEKKYTNEGVTASYDVVRIKNTNSTKVNVKELLSEKVDLSITKEEPSVLIYHTHTTESYQYLDRKFYAVGSVSRNNSADRNMVKVGDAICEQLEKAGYNVIHDTTVHDAKYTGAYERSRATVSEYLKKYPSIQVTLDIHRDAIEEANGTKIKPTAEINGKKAAQVMIISGCQENGNGIENFPDWRYNLIFAVHLQKQMETNFKGLTRPIFFCPRRYNMNMTRCSLLLEIGSDSNTLEEAYFSGRCIGKSLAELLSDYTEEK